MTSGSGYSPGAAGRAECAAAQGERRRRLAEMMVARRPIRECAEALGVGLSTIGRDRKHILRQWAAEATKTIGEHKARMMQDLDHDERDLRATLADIETKFENPAHVVDLDAFKVLLAAKAAFHDRIREVQRRRAKLLGLDAPTKTAVALWTSGGSGGEGGHGAGRRILEEPDRVRAVAGILASVGALGPGVPRVIDVAAVDSGRGDPGPGDGAAA